MKRDALAVDLGPDGMAFFDRVLGENLLSAGEVAILAMACGVLDTIATLTESMGDVVTHGSTGQPIVHPIIGAITDQRRLLATLLDALALPPATEDQGDGEGRVYEFANRRRRNGST